MRSSYTSAEVDDKIGKKECVGHTIEDDPVRAEIVVEESYGYRKHDEICQQKNEHEHVPVESIQHISTYVVNVSECLGLNVPLDT